MVAIAAVIGIASASTSLDDARSIVADRAAKLTRDSAWKSAGAVRLQFRTWHPQGLVKIDRTLFLSSVEVRSSDRREGVAHLFKIDMAGARVASLALGEGAVYHPRGIDYDRRDIWVPGGEYRPDNRSIVYRLHPPSIEASPAFRI